MSDHTPTTGQVRDAYVSGSNLHRETIEQHYLAAPAPDYGAEFDRWLTAHVAQAVDAAVSAQDAATDDGAEDQDDEEFCGRCHAGVLSAEHHEKCVVLEWAEEGESAPADAPAWSVDPGRRIGGGTGADR